MKCCPPGRLRGERTPAFCIVLEFKLGGILSGPGEIVVECVMTTEEFGKSPVECADEILEVGHVVQSIV